MRSIFIGIAAFAVGVGVATLVDSGRKTELIEPHEVVIASSVGAQASPVGDSPNYSLPNTNVHLLRSEKSARTYPIWVDVPASYTERGDGKKYPIVFVTDAGYSFPLVRSIRNLLGQRGRNIEDFILVGLAPAEGDTSAASRSRDYTPTNPLPSAKADDGTYNAQLRYGEAIAYRDHLESEVFPYIEKHYRADMRRKVLAGHSLGGLFGAYVLLTKPAMFQHYILSSPSLWFDAKSILKFERDYAAQHRDLDARVSIYAGSFETIRAEPRYFKSVDIVEDMKRFKKLLESRRYSGLRIDTKVIADEDHLTVYPSAIGRGLLNALPGFGPYTSG